MAFKYAIRIALILLYFFAEPVLNASISDISGETNTNPDDPNDLQVDIKVDDPEIPVGVNVIDPETFRSAQYKVLYGGTGSPDSTSDPFPLSLYVADREMSITLHLIDNKTSEVIDSAQLPPNADFIPEGATKVLIMNSSVVNGIGLIQFANLVPERSIILNLINPVNGKIQISVIVYKGTDEKVPPITLPVNNYLPVSYIVVTTNVPPSQEVKGLEIIYFQ
ncbi:uncharacterized protein [Periplaneta americana]|uniref:uncharacterized protein n=1 Tax=Periplaneta americana TaxID=6978 RepID=UPI0037E8AD27